MVDFGAQGIVVGVVWLDAATVRQWVAAFAHTSARRCSPRCFDGPLHSLPRWARLGVTLAT